MRIAGGRLRMSAPRSYSPYPRSPVTGVTPWTRHWISGAQNLSGWSEFPPGHWALAVWKIEAGAAPLLRLPLPNQPSRSVSTVGAAHWAARRHAGPVWDRPLRKDKRVSGYSVGAGVLTRPPVL